MRTTIRRGSVSKAELGAMPGTAGAIARVITGCLAMAAFGCGGGSPLLHPAHVNRPGVVSIGAGASGQIALRTLGAEASDADQLQDATVAPGVAPWVGGRVGLR